MASVVPMYEVYNVGISLGVTGYSRARTSLSSSVRSLLLMDPTTRCLSTLGSWCGSNVSHLNFVICLGVSVDSVVRSEHQVSNCLHSSGSTVCRSKWA